MTTTTPTYRLDTLTVDEAYTLRRGGWITIGDTTYDLPAEALQGTDYATLAHEALLAFADVRQDLIGSISDAERQLRDARTSLLAGGSVNALGILQRSADEVDRNAALFGERVRNVVRLVRAASANA